MAASPTWTARWPPQNILHQQRGPDRGWLRWDPDAAGPDARQAPSAWPPPLHQCQHHPDRRLAQRRDGHRHRRGVPGDGIDRGCSRPLTLSASARAPPTGPSATIAAAVALILATDTTTANWLRPHRSRRRSSPNRRPRPRPTPALLRLPPTFLGRLHAGAGSGGAIGVAGSVPINIIYLTTSASLLAVTSPSRSSRPLSPSPAPPVTPRPPPPRAPTPPRLFRPCGLAGGSKVGVGASLALNSVNESTTTMGNGAVITGTRNLTLSATTRIPSTPRPTTGPPRRRGPGPGGGHLRRQRDHHGLPRPHQPGPRGSPAASASPPPRPPPCATIT